MAHPARPLALSRLLAPALLVALGCAAGAPAAVAAPAPAEVASGAAPPGAGEPCPAQPEPAGEAGAAPAHGYDRWLGGYAYPFETKRLPVVVQGVARCMAFMDVLPAQPNGLVAVLLHGKNFSGAYWQQTAELLRDRGYRVIMPDQLGFGKSSKPVDVQYSFALLARNTALLLDSLGVSRATIVGHSMGGMLATRFAVQHPERTDRLVLVNPIGLEDYRLSLPYLGVDAWEERALARGPGAIQQYMQESYFHGTWQPAYDPLLEIQRAWSLGPDRALLARVSALTDDMIYTQPVVYELGHVRAPALLIIGQADRTAPGKAELAPESREQLGNYPVLGERAARAIPRAKLVALEGVGHVPQFESFDRYAQALLSFLGPTSAVSPAAAAPAGRPGEPAGEGGRGERVGD